MTISFAPLMTFTANETISVDAASAVTINQSGFNLSGVRLTDTSTPAATKAHYHDHTFTAGAVTVDLTALVDSVGVAFSGLGLKVQALIIKNPAGNASINLAPGASNGYDIFGAGNDITIPGHASYDNYLSFYFPEGTPDVAAGDKTLDFTGTGTQSFYLGIVLG